MTMIDAEQARLMDLLKKEPNLASRLVQAIEDGRDLLAQKNDPSLDSYLNGLKHLLGELGR